MIKKLILVSIAFVLLSYTRLSGQYSALYNFYNLEPIILNPAGAGLSQDPVAFFDYRKQWAGLQGAPKILSGSVHGQVFKNMGLGLNLYSYESSIFKIFSGSINYAYTVKISDDHIFTPGLSVGLKQTSLNKNGLTFDELEDPALYSSMYDRLFITTGFGFRYQYKNLRVDFAIPELYSGEDKTIARSMLGFAAYDFYTADNIWLIQPSALITYVQTQKPVLDVNFLVEYNRILWTQLGYRSNKDVNIMLGVNYKGIGIAYNFSMTNSGMENISYGSHEIALLYKIPFSFLK